MSRKVSTKAKAKSKSKAKSTQGEEETVPCWSGDYHDSVWARTKRFFVGPESEVYLFRYICLELMQCGLNWKTILNKEPAFVEAFDGFEVDKVALYGDGKLEELLGNAGIIRHRGKLVACIENAKICQNLRAEHGSLQRFFFALGPTRDTERILQKTLSSHMRTDLTSGMDREVADGVHPTVTVAKATKVLRGMGFKFYGETTVLSLFQASGLVNHHKTNCTVWKACEEEYAEVKAALDVTDEFRERVLTPPPSKKKSRKTVKVVSKKKKKKTATAGAGAGAAESDKPKTKAKSTKATKAKAKPAKKESKKRQGGAPAPTLASPVEDEAADSGSGGLRRSSRKRRRTTA